MWGVGRGSRLAVRGRVNNHFEGIVDGRRGEVLL